MIVCPAPRLQQHVSHATIQRCLSSPLPEAVRGPSRHTTPLRYMREHFSPQVNRKQSCTTTHHIITVNTVQCITLHITLPQHDTMHHKSPITPPQTMHCSYHQLSQAHQSHYRHARLHGIAQHTSHNRSPPHRTTAATHHGPTPRPTPPPPLTQLASRKVEKRR